jgi:hypothetical protein
VANAKPYYTSDDLVASIQRRISYPLSANTFLYDDLMAFLNEELQLSAVPTVKETHEEYFVFKVETPLVNGISRYEIPNRAIGMALRDVKYSDTYGNFYDMTRIAPDDKAFFQQSNGSNQTVAKYYLEGNELVLTPSIVSGASGFLNQFIFLRPNNLVRNTRAATIVRYHKNITISNFGALAAGDVITISVNNQSQNPLIYYFTAISGGTPVENQFLIGTDSITTAINLTTAINNANIGVVIANSATNVVDCSYNEISASFIASNTTAFTIDNVNLDIEFNQLPNTYTDPDTDQTSTLYQAGVLVDFLQTNPGHRTYNFDVPLISISAGNRAKFPVIYLQTHANNSSGGALTYYNIKIGDYICLQNECIIPQIPPELHNALAERAASRILAAIGDVQGYQVSQAKIAEMDKKTDILIGSRIESSVPKVFNRYSLLRMGKSRFRRRY